LAKLYHTLRKYPEAEACYQRALVVWERQAEEHPLIAPTLAGLALIACSQAQYERAEALLQRAQRICARIDEAHPAHIATLLGVAHLREGQERYAEAQVCCARALAGQRRSLGAQHPHTLATRQWLARLQSL
jgi:tetratricopeptide (TPR) repeat protein